MRRLDNVKLFECKYVADLFEYATKRAECSSKVFVKAFVYSSISKRIASGSFYFESLDIVAAYEMIKKEKSLNRGDDVFPSFVMSWIGYIMQYFVCATGVPLTVLYRKIKPEELYRLYEAYHSLDNELVVGRIAEEKGINIELNNVEIMKSIYGLG